MLLLSLSRNVEKKWKIKTNQKYTTFIHKKNPGPGVCSCNVIRKAAREISLINHPESRIGNAYNTMMAGGDWKERGWVSSKMKYLYYSCTACISLIRPNQYTITIAADGIFTSKIKRSTLLVYNQRLAKPETESGQDERRKNDSSNNKINATVAYRPMQCTPIFLRCV